MDLSPEAIRRALASSGPLPEARFYEQQAAVAVVLRREGATTDVLLMRRVEHRGDPWSGHVSLPGGRADPGDAGLAGTAVRETREEVSLDLAACADLLGHLDPIRPIVRLTARPMNVTPLVFLLVRPAEPSPGAEAQRVFWLPLERAASGELDGSFRYALGPLSRSFPCWNHDGEVIWGLTYRVLRGLLARLG